ncbi:hypothetical protein Thiowin_03224 [Thiorhodovibrio winogradskyi]|uniref:Uncharacterized protein n=1 Tax=Thiorhodovibrio winogradskyi TaxID=77007 RepID=A0ABZ0SC72_9GAMM|nr:CsbD family protein [Thiorhodovibrio winogradskyi]
MNKQQVKSRHEHAKGKVKANADHFTSYNDLDAEGKNQQNTGKAQASADRKAKIKNDNRDKKNSY